MIKLKTNIAKVLLMVMSLQGASACFEQNDYMYATKFLPMHEAQHTYHPHKYTHHTYTHLSHVTSMHTSLRCTPTCI